MQVFGLGVVRFAPYEMRLGPDGPSREPDLLVVRTEHLDRIKPSRLDGPADLVVELISEESNHRDRVDKFDEYEAAGVSEYWILDPRPSRNRAYFYRLDERGQYQASARGSDGLYASVVLPGFILPIDLLWQVPLPPVLRVLHEMVGDEALHKMLQ